MSWKQFLKLILNAFYGRTAINVGKFLDFFFANDHLRALQLIRQPNYFKSFVIIDDSLVLIEMKRKKVYLNNHQII
jgi:hypothetical protein